MPETGLAVDKQVQDGFCEIGNISGRDHQIAGGADLLPVAEAADHVGGEIVRIERGEEGGGSDHQVATGAGQQPLLHHHLAAAIDVQGPGFVGLETGPPQCAVEHEIARQADQR